MTCRYVAIALMLGAACTSASIDSGFDNQVDGGAVGGDPDNPAGQSSPARYRADQLRSPLTESVVARISAIASQNRGGHPASFMKVGASGTVSDQFLDCFSSNSVELAGRDSLQATIDHYNAPVAAGSPSWARTTLAAMVGRTASWVQSGDPSPLEEEIAAIAPTVALLNYGTNDMGMGTSYESALWPFYENMSTLLDRLEDQGIVPILSGLNPRTDKPEAGRWVPTYDAVTRAMAEARQLPYISLFEAARTLPNQGMSGDGIHGNAYSGGACRFDGEGLLFNYNNRNLLTLEVLDLLRRTWLLGEDAEADTEDFIGAGDATDPFIVDRLPFSHHGNTQLSNADMLDAYPACDSGQNESGPELYYRLDITETTPIRALVLTRGEVDVDLHLLANEPTALSCIARAHRTLETTLDPGTYYLVVDSFVGQAERSGPFSLVVLACEPGDARCQQR